MSSSPLRELLITEGLMKLAGGLIFIGSPRTILNVVLPTSTEAATAVKGSGKNAPNRTMRAPTATAAATLLTRMLGTQTFTLGIAMLLASRGDAASVASRRVVYWTVCARDATLVAVLGWQLLRQQRLPKNGRVSDDELEGSLGSGGVEEEAPLQLSSAGLRSWIAEIAPFLTGHLWLLLLRPQWFAA
ncbi:hypothetical protein BX600DRAFT_532266 [Xylariales sp. PMI_506]|nr:hypothetical protein BX600DRAFT_532266 [Xylariales sp. PMI_506]